MTIRATYFVAMSEKAEQIIERRWRRFGRWVFEKRTQRRWTQEFCAERAGMKRQQWQRIEKGASTKAVTVLRIAEALDTDSDEALTMAGFDAGLDADQKKVEGRDADRKAEAARTAEMVENFMELPPDRQATAIELIKVLKAKHPKALEISGPKFKIIDADEYEQLEPHIEETKKEKDTHNEDTDQR